MPKGKVPHAEVAGSADLNRENVAVLGGAGLAALVVKAFRIFKR